MSNEEKIDTLVKNLNHRLSHIETAEAQAFYDTVNAQVFVFSYFGEGNQVYSVSTCLYLDDEECFTPEFLQRDEDYLVKATELLASLP